MLQLDDSDDGSDMDESEDTAGEEEEYAVKEDEDYEVSKDGAKMSPVGRKRSIGEAAEPEAVAATE